MNIVCVVVLWATFCFQLITAHPPQRDDSEALIILRQIAEGGKSEKDMVDKHLYMYLDSFEKMSEQFNDSFPDRFCANESALRDLHENMEQKLDQVKEALDLKQEQLLDLANILTHDNYSTTGLNTDLAAECESLKDYIKEANNTALAEKMELDQHMNDAKDLKEKMDSHACPCEWKEWSEWSDCSATCGTGTMTRTREILKKAKNGGQQCAGEKNVIDSCNLSCCPVNCVWGEWTEFDDCRHGCPRFDENHRDTWVKRRERSKIIDETCGGICDGSDFEHEGCDRVSDLMKKVSKLEGQLEKAAMCTQAPTTTTTTTTTTTITTTTATTSCTQMNLTTKTYGIEISWDFGSCSSGSETYGNNQVYTTDCCQPPGEYTLTCKDNYGDGWNGGYIQVGSSPTKICEDFTDGKSQNQTIVMQ